MTPAVSLLGQSPTLHDIRPRFERLTQQSRLLASLTVSERARALTPFMEAIARQKTEIVARIQKETGKTATDALVSEVLGVLDYLQWLQKNAPRLLRDESVPVPLLLMGKKAEIWHQPLGVGVIIAPWNYPFHIGVTAIATAFVAGNCVAYKPSEWTPLEGLLESLFASSPLLAQSVDVFYGDGHTGAALIDCQPQRVCFTGSIPTGRKIMAQCARYGIPLELELGGKDAALVFEDVNLDRTVSGVLWGGMTNSGQSCTSVERLLVHESIYHDFVDRLKVGCEALVVNQDQFGESDVGQMTTEFQLAIVERQLAQACSRGAKILCGGQRLKQSSLFFQPTIVEVPDTQCDLWQEETFGPVIAVQKFSHEEEAIAAANALAYGLSASLWTKDIKRARRVAQRLKAGAVSINNVMLTEGHPGLPFGGTGASGFGKVKGKDGLLAWVNRKAVMIDAQNNHIEPNWYPYTPEKYALFEQLIEVLFRQKGFMKWVRLALIGLRLDKVAKMRR